VVEVKWKELSSKNRGGDKTLKKRKKTNRERKGKKREGSGMPKLPNLRGGSFSHGAFSSIQNAKSSN